MAFNRIFSETVSDLKVDNTKPMDRYFEVAYSGAMFDARVFNIPREEATNYFYWRQLDASRNSIQMVGQANFSHKELQHKSCNDIQDMLMTKKGINWNDFPAYQKRGSCVVKENYFQSCEDASFIITSPFATFIFVIRLTKITFIKFVHIYTSPTFTNRSIYSLPSPLKIGISLSIIQQLLHMPLSDSSSSYGSEQPAGSFINFPSFSGRCDCFN